MGRRLAVDVAAVGSPRLSRRVHALASSPVCRPARLDGDPEGGERDGACERRLALVSLVHSRKMSGRQGVSRSALLAGTVHHSTNTSQAMRARLSPSSVVEVAPAALPATHPLGGIRRLCDGDAKVLNPVAPLGYTPACARARTDQLLLEANKRRATGLLRQAQLLL